MDAFFENFDPLYGYLGVGFCYLFALGLFICIKTKKGRKFLGIE